MQVAIDPHGADRLLGARRRAAGLAVVAGGDLEAQAVARPAAFPSVLRVEARAVAVAHHRG